MIRVSPYRFGTFGTYVCTYTPYCTHLLVRTSPRVPVIFSFFFVFRERVHGLRVQGADMTSLSFCNFCAIVA